MKKTTKSKKPAKPTKADAVKPAAETSKKTEPKSKPSSKKGRVKKAAGRPRRKKREAAKVTKDDQAKLIKKRLEAGRKAAITRKANSGRRGPGRPTKAASQVKLENSKAQEFTETVLNVGIERSEALLRKIRAAAKEV